MRVLKLVIQLLPQNFTEVSECAILLRYYIPEAVGKHNFSQIKKHIAV